MHKERRSRVFAKVSVIPAPADNSNRIVVVQDISAQKQAELIGELGWIINSSLSIGTIFRMIASEIKKLVSYDRASLLLYNEKDSHLLIFALDTELKTKPEERELLRLLRAQAPDGSLKTTGRG